MNHSTMPHDASIPTNMWSSTTTTERPPRLQRSLETAIYLNNAAVTLLTRRRVDEALDTMQDALLVLECVVRSSRSTMSLPQLSDTPQLRNGEHQLYEHHVAQEMLQLLLSADDTTCLIHKAASRLARSSTTVNHAETTTYTIPVVSFSGAIDEALLQHSASASAAATTGNGWAVRINDAEFLQQDWLESVHEIVPAIFLSNLALIHFHGDNGSVDIKPETTTAAALTNPATTQTTTALQWLDVALTLLIVHHRLVNVSEGNMCVALVILHNICTVQPEHDNVAGSRQQLVLLQQMACQFCRFTNGAADIVATDNNDCGAQPGGVLPPTQQQPNRSSGVVTAAAA
jgi:hypothetical protein